MVDVKLRDRDEEYLIKQKFVLINYDIIIKLNELIESIRKDIYLYDLGLINDRDLIFSVDYEVDYYSNKLNILFDEIREMGEGFNILI